MRNLLTSILAFGFVAGACGQQGAPTPSKPADSGPTLAQTMQFIQEKLSQQGQVAWVQTLSNQPGVNHRAFVSVGDVMADPGACALYTTTTLDTSVDLPKGKNLVEGGRPVSADDLRTHKVETYTTPFKQVEKITVENTQDMTNQAYTEAGYPDVKVTVTPPVFYVKLWASNAVFPGHTSSRKGKQAPVQKDVTSKTNGITFRDEETANKVAKAMTHAMELCGGGVTKKDLF